MLDQISEQLKQISPLTRFSQISSDQFRAELERIEQPFQAVKETIVEQVESGQLTPVQGLSWLSCAVGQSYGYSEFHGQPNASDSVARAMGYAGISTP